jgi:uncharacterized caspase-like protein
MVTENEQQAASDLNAKMSLKWLKASERVHSVLWTNISRAKNKNKNLEGYLASGRWLAASLDASVVRHSTVCPRSRCTNRVLAEMVVLLIMANWS